METDIVSTVQKLKRLFAPQLAQFDSVPPPPYRPEAHAAAVAERAAIQSALDVELAPLRKQERTHTNTIEKVERQLRAARTDLASVQHEINQLRAPRQSRMTALGCSLDRLADPAINEAIDAITKRFESLERQTIPHNQFEAIAAAVTAARAALADLRQQTVDNVGATIAAIESRIPWL